MGGKPDISLLPSDFSGKLKLKKKGICQILTPNIISI
jgi:hypothetical protein